MDTKTSSFCQEIYDVCSQIPQGKVATYGQLAKLVGKPKSARAVGMCMRKNPNVPVMPCHRVVASDGKLQGYSAGAGVFTKYQMLLDEGVKFNNDKVDLSQSQWQPEKVILD